MRKLLGWLSALFYGVEPSGSKESSLTNTEIAPAPQKNKTLVNLGTLSIESSALTRQLKNDIRDDWFPDPLQFEDMFSGQKIPEIIRKNVELNSGSYRPSSRILFNIPKTGFTLRYALETSLSDRALYQGLTSFLIPFYDRLIPWNSFSHRFDYERARASDRYTFKNGIQAWKHFVGAARSAVTDENYMLSTDVANFFENIKLEKLRLYMETLEPEINASPAELKNIQKHRALLFECLKDWSYEKESGLPQNRDASSFLANLYMREVDLTMRNAGYADTYFRYMDDIKIVCPDEFFARKALKDLTICLRSLGLSVNSKKTKLIPGYDKDEIEKYLDGSSDAIEQIDLLWQRKNRQAIFLLWPLLRDKTLELIAAGDVDSREFRYCIKRIELLASYSDLHFPKELYTEITKAICNAVAIHPACTDQYVKYLAAVDLTIEELKPVIEYLCIPEKSIYTWQSYRLWLLMANKKVVSDQLIEAATVSLSALDSPARAGASIYLGVMGSEKNKLEVAEKFETVRSFIGQRSPPRQNSCRLHRTKNPGA
ncbi:MAG: reverse transcriptase domain-containing protein, partial [Pseudomonadota bacterium]